jgi:hypothetical protein
MHGLNKKIPKEGYLIQLCVYKDETHKEADIFMGSVTYADRKSITLEGLYNNTFPMRACKSSGKFVPTHRSVLQFPRPKTAMSLHFWRKVPTVPEKVGQYIVFVDTSPVSMSVMNTKDIIHSKTSGKLMCLIGGTHSFYATSITDLQQKLKEQEIVAFPEYTDGIYNDMLSLLKLSVQSKVLHAFKEMKTAT